MNGSESGRDGARVVVTLYALLVAVSGVAGVLVGVFVDGLRPPVLFFLVPLPATPFGFALYGAVTVAVALGVPLALVVATSHFVVADETSPSRPPKD